MRLNNQKGSILIEGLIAILLFSFGLLGTAAFQMATTRQTTNVQYRLQASLLVNSAMGEIEADPTQLVCYTKDVTCADATRANTWYAKVSAMPGATTYTPTVVTDAASGVTTLTVYWSLPKEKDLNGNVVVHSMRAQVAQVAGA